MPQEQNSEAITVEHRPPFTVKLTYFKDSGKYYSDGEYKSNKLFLGEIFQEVWEMLKQGKRPGLVDGANDFYVLVNVPDHPHDHPKLIVPETTIGNPPKKLHWC